MDILNVLFDGAERDPVVVEQSIKVMESLEAAFQKLIGTNPVKMMSVHKVTNEVEQWDFQQIAEHLKTGVITFPTFMRFMSYANQVYDHLRNLETPQERQEFIDSLNPKDRPFTLEDPVDGTKITLPAGADVSEVSAALNRIEQSGGRIHTDISSDWIQKRLSQMGEGTEIPLRLAHSLTCHGVLRDFGIKLEIFKKPAHLARIIDGYSNGIDIWIYIQNPEEESHSPHIAVTSSAPFPHKELYAEFHNYIDLAWYFRILVPRGGFAFEKLELFATGEGRRYFTSCDCTPENEYASFEEWLNLTLAENGAAYSTWHGLIA